MPSQLYFYHSNGFPAETYGQLFEFLKDLETQRINVLGGNIPSLNGSYDSLVQEVIDHASSAKGDAIGVGHSLGATLCLLSKVKEPKIFRKVVLLDPPIFNPCKRFAVSILRKMGVEHLITPAGKAMKRREVFNSREEAIDYFENKTLFKNISKRTIELYAEHGLVQKGNKFKLTISREREAEIFLNFPVSLPSNAFTVKGDLIYSEVNPLLSRIDLWWWKQSFPKVNLIPFPAGHLFPLEKPKELSDLLRTILRKSLFK